MKALAKSNALVPALALLLCTGSGFAAPAQFHIGFCTESVAQGEDDLRGAEQIMKEYGDVKNGGMVRIVIAPDDFMSQQETLISNMVGLAEDPLMKVIVTCNMLPGTAEAFKRIRAKRPDILLLGAIPAEDPLVISKAADLVVDYNFVARGYTIPWVAKQLGAKTLVHISFPRHMSYEMMARRAAVMKAACSDLGIKFAFQSSPDPTSDVGVAGAQQFLLEKMPAWIEQYGGATHEKVAFFATNDAQAEPIIKCIVASKTGVFPEPGSPSPIMGFPGALGVDLSAERGNWPGIMKKIEDTMAAKAAQGRLGTWAFSSGYVFTAGLGELGKRVVEGKAKLTNTKDIYKALGKYSPGASWNGSFYTDMSTGAQVRNDLCVYMDTYVFGKGYMGTTKLTIPEKYFAVK